MKKIILFAVLMSVLVSGCVSEPEQPIGGQRDEYGCLGPAGYTYNEELALCARDWEIVSEDHVRAIRKASESMSDRYGLTIVELITEDCEGCFVVKFDKFGEYIEVRLADWKITE